MPEPAEVLPTLTRAKRVLLLVLKEHGPMTAEELSDIKDVGGGAVSVRNHLRTLHAAGLVEYEEEVRSVGRPVRRYHLAAAANGLFPKQYERLCLELVRAVQDQSGGAGWQRLLERWEDELVDYLGPALSRRPGGVLQALADHQSASGFMAALETQDERTILIERHCPIARLAKHHPEICRHEASLYQRTLGRPVTLESCQALGDPVCRFGIEPAE